MMSGEPEWVMQLELLCPLPQSNMLADRGEDAQLAKGILRKRVFFVGKGDEQCYQSQLNVVDHGEY